MGNIAIKLRDNTVSVNGLVYQTNGSLLASVNSTNASNVDIEDTLRGVYIVFDSRYDFIVDESGTAYGASASATVTALNDYFGVDNPAGIAKQAEKIDQFAGVDSWDATKAGQVIIVKSGIDQGVTNSNVLLSDLAVLNSAVSFDDITMVNNGTVDGRDVAADGTKLDTIATGAEVNVNADWDATSGDAQILNKPDFVLDEQYEIDELKRENNIEIGSTGTTTDRIHDVVNEAVASDSSTTTGISLLGYWDGSKMTLRGMVAVGAAISSPVAGAPLYLGTSGAMTHTAPTTTGYIARVVGYYITQLQSGDHMVYFDPSGSWVEID